MKKGGTVVLLGADGCGKSTIADLLMKELQERRISVNHQHWRPMLLPSPRIFIGQQPNSDPSFPHKKKIHPALLSVFLSIYYWADFWVGHFVRALSFIRMGGVLITERYIYDMLVDPVRHRLNIWEGWASFLCKVAPSPRLIVFLVGDSKILYERKGELDSEEIDRQQKRIDQCLRCYARTVSICTTDRFPEDVVKQIEEQMISLGMC